MVNMGRIHEEIRKFMMISSNLIKLNNKLMVELGKIVDYERDFQGVSTESKIIEFGFDFAEKLKIEVGDDFQKLELQK